MDDFTKIYQEIYKLSTKLYNIEDTLDIEHLGREVNKNMNKIINIDLELDHEGILRAQVTGDTTLSQFQRAIFSATVRGFNSGNPLAVRLYVNTPNQVTGDESEPSDYLNSIYMMPSPEGINKFEQSLNQAVGLSLPTVIGETDFCKIAFGVFDGETEHFSNTSSQIKLYKSNTSQSYSPNDLTSVFKAIDELNKRLTKIEGGV